ncbi:MAG: hypothetical protein M1825_005086 [Sarcosagium campestre]|nr:MAG: hypothetical protein M1825_005086 [Sarcosagium campestre]
MNSIYTKDKLKSSAETKEAVLKDMRDSILQANASQLMMIVNDACFEKCVSSQVGTSYTAAETTCYNQCVKKYIAAWNVVTNSWEQKMQNSRNDPALR